MRRDNISIIKNTEELNNLLDAVQKLPVKKEEQEKVIDITENGTTVVTPDEGMTLGGVTVNVAVESGGGEDDFVGIKYSNFESQRNLPRTADARSFDKVLSELNSPKADNSHCMTYAFANTSRSAGSGYGSALEEVYLPSKIRALFTTFSNCTELAIIHGDLSNVIELNAGTFQYCRSLDIKAVIERMPKLSILGNLSFADCTQITEITLPATITQISGGAFARCTNLLNIYVPWAEGAIKNAPWGATNATIHYNSEV